MIRNRTLAWLLAGCIAALAAPAVLAQDVKGAPDALIQKVSNDVLDAVRSDKSIKQGDIQKVMALVDQKVMPFLDFRRMTATAVGRYWRQATPDQQQQLQDQFKTLLVRTYSGALAQVRDQHVELKPMRSAPDDKEVVVRTEVKGDGDPIQLDYRLALGADGWRIYDVNVLGVWLVDNYRNSFAQEISANGIDGLIKKMTERNTRNAASAKG